MRVSSLPEAALVLDGDPDHPAGRIPSRITWPRGLGRGEQLVPGVLVDHHLLGQALLALAILPAHALGQSIAPDLEELGADPVDGAGDGGTAKAQGGAGAEAGG